MARENKKDIKIEEFRKMFLKSAESISAKADLLLEAGNIPNSGNIVEEYLKDFFNSMLSSRFKATSGYIIYAKDLDSPFKISPHIDLIIVDTWVPHTFFPQVEFSGKTDFIPKESVVGIFEIKKTLNRNSIKQALDHITKIMRSVEINKNDYRHFNKSGERSARITQHKVNNRYPDMPQLEVQVIPTDYHEVTGIYTNPITGIIGLQHKIKKRKNYDDFTDMYDSEKYVDIIFSFDGILHFISSKVEHKEFYVGPISSPKSFQYSYLDKTTSNLNIALGLVTYYLSKTTAEQFDISKYYFSNSIRY